MSWSPCKPYLTSLAMLLVAMPAIGQQSAASKSRIYQQAVADQFKIFSGRQYVWPTAHFENGHPFYLTTEFIKGTIWYDGNRYDSVDLLLNEAADEVITRNYLGTDLIQLYKPLIQSFSINGMQFVNMGAQLGFCQLLHTGKVNVYRKLNKKIVEKPVINRTLYYIREEERYYAAVNGGLKELSDRDDVLAVFDKNGDLQSFLKKKNLNFRKNREAYIMAAAGFNDQSAN